ncbi:MAG TPA: hypothetical protein VLE69_04255 [Candidatus Saccharimonadales bacterium]|nr:hypothetical protein [Candidatus Saccharimonadales bacterium]
MPNEQTPTDKLLSPSMMSKLADSEATRTPIAADQMQSAMKELGQAASHDMPAPGQDATMRFKNGGEQQVTVTDYTKSNVQVDIPSGQSTYQSNVALGAFEELTRDTRAE